MSNEVFASELFVDVTEEQQQLVSGGDGKYYPGLKELAKSKYEAATKKFELNVMTEANAKGASTMKSITFDTAKLESLAIDDIVVGNIWS